MQWSCTVYNIILNSHTLHSWSLYPMPREYSNLTGWFHNRRRLLVKDDCILSVRLPTIVLLYYFNIVRNAFNNNLIETLPVLCYIRIAFLTATFTDAMVIVMVNSDTMPQWVLSGVLQVHGIVDLIVYESGNNFGGKNNYIDCYKSIEFRLTQKRRFSSIKA